MTARHDAPVVGLVPEWEAKAWPAMNAGSVSSECSAAQTGHSDQRSSVERRGSQSLYENFRDMLRKDDDFGLFSSAEVGRNTIPSSPAVC